MRLRPSTPLALAAVVLALAACKKNEAAVTDSTATSGTPAAAAPMPMDSAAMRDSAMKHDSTMQRDTSATAPARKP